MGEMGLTHPLSKRDTERLYECYICEFFERCMSDISEPEYNTNDSCKTKSIFMDDLTKGDKYYEN